MITRQLNWLITLWSHDCILLSLIPVSVPTYLLYLICLIHHSVGEIYLWNVML